MKLISSLLLSSTAALAIVTAQAADLPSRKSAPASYVKICDAYGAGYFYIPGTDTCVKLGGYVRAEYQYVPSQDIYTYTAPATPAQISVAQDTTGMEVRGRIDVDARTPTNWGVARTFVRLRGANTSGNRNDPIVNNGISTPSIASTVALTIESAMVQWAGFTFGIAPENYAFMPSYMYHSNPWTGFPNGMKQIAYTASLGNGLSATVAIEDKNDLNNAGGTGNFTYLSRPDTAYALVGNIRLDQSWGFAALHGMVDNNSVRGDYGTASGLTGAAAFGNALGVIPTYSATSGGATFNAYAIGGTLQYKLPILSPGDAVYLTANYTKGILSSLMSTGGLNNGGSTASDKRFLGGILRVDQNMVVTSGSGSTASPFTLGSITGWNLAASGVHYWSSNWRSQVSAGYIEINPPTSTLTEWGKGRLWEAAGSLIFSPVRDFDIGLEVQYLNLKNSIQNPSTAFVAAGSPGLSESGISTKLRVERTF